jgi:hypothetical protein
MAQTKRRPKPDAAERDAVVAMLDGIRHAEAQGAKAFAAWAAICRTAALRGGLRIIAEREGYHAKVFATRLKELGARPGRSFPADPHGEALGACMADPAVPDLEKLCRFNAYIGPPDSISKPIEAFARDLKHDLDTREALLLHAADEFSTLRWLRAMESRLAQG